MEKSAGLNRPDAPEAFDASSRDNRRFELMACVSAPSRRPSAIGMTMTMAVCVSGMSLRTGRRRNRRVERHDNFQMPTLSSGIRTDHDSHLTPPAELRQLPG